MAGSPRVATPPAALDQRGNISVWWVPDMVSGSTVTPGVADLTKPKKTEVDAGSDITYSFLPDGFDFKGAQDKKEDDRLGLKQVLESLDVNKVSLSLKYVDSPTVGASARAVLKAGKSGTLVLRTGVPYEQDSTVGDLVSPIWVDLGAQNRGPLDNTGKFTVVQETAIKNVVGEPVALVA